MEAPVSYSVRIKGQVQGVSFRYAAREEAARRNIRGFVRNERDGSVYMEIEGARESVEAFLQWCEKGPLGANVAQTIANEMPIRSFERFEIQ
jgi:acylphosphatase